jgi:hypothetical protein
MKLKVLDAILLVEQAASLVVLCDGDDPHSAYRRLAQLIHPDHVLTKSLQGRAAAAFVKLNALHDSWQNKAPAPPSVKIGNWTIDRPLVKGDVADLYLAYSLGKKGVLKVVRSEDDNDLMDAEYRALSKMYSNCHSTLRDYWKYVPVPLENFEASDRKVNVLSWAEGFLPLSEIVGMLPTKLDFRHVVWMMNRSLSALGFIHRNGYIHGGITPAHLLFHPEKHGLVIVGWCSAVELHTDAHIPVVATDWESMYPPEVARKRNAHPATDIYMVAKSLLHAVDPIRIPTKFRPLLDYCLTSSPASRPVDAWDFQDEWKKAAEREYGKPQFVKLELPVN